MSVFLPAKQLLADTLEVKNRIRTELTCKLVLAMDTAKNMERTEVYFYDLEGVTTSVIDSVLTELRGLGYGAEYVSGQREGRYLVITWGNA